jgi:hypothetical protein
VDAILAAELFEELRHRPVQLGPAFRLERVVERPRGCVTRASSSAIARWSGAKITPTDEETTSKLASS